MALQTKTEIFISSTPIVSYVSLKLIQEIDAHHDLELVCRTDTVDKLTNELIGNSKEFLGQTITIKISAIEAVGGYKELKFKGLITKIKGTKAFHQPKGDLVTIFAKSTSILADHAPDYNSFLDVSLSDILTRVFQGYDTSKLVTSFSPVSSDTIHYSVQHHQSAYDYSSRLAAYYNEWFYYDGEKLIFGKPSTDETILTYGTDLQEFSLELHPVPNSFNPNGPGIPPDQPQAHAINQVIANGISDNPGVNLGEIIKIDGYGRYRITKITHNNNEGGKYSNTFEAVDANFNVYPKTDIDRFPKSDTQIGVVADNNDPDGLGRIKVEFPWQKPKGETTPWIRIMTPHAGSDKGFHFIPEIGEKVIVDFESGNAERPYATGTLYHGNAKPDSWKTTDNDIKAIRTRSGHTIELNDTKKGEFITIVDINGNTIKLDTVGKTITIDAPEHIFLNSKNISLKATENINLESGENYRLQTKELKEQISGNAQVHVDNAIKEVSKTHEKQTEEITIKAASKVDVQTPDFNHGV